MAPRRQKVQGEFAGRSAAAVRRRHANPLAATTPTFFPPACTRLGNGWPGWLAPTTSSLLSPPFASPAEARILALLARAAN